ncbi:MAG: hypothetical protein IT577_04040 [Verrucomicrobiae bacterium]|nr:hypothetical protein [Verrucomicrobiae bacterium]
MRSGTMFWAGSIFLLQGISHLAMASTPITNGGFETGALAPWRSTGVVSVATGSVSNIAPAEGSFQAVISGFPGTVSQAALETFLGLAPGALNSINTIGGPADGSAMAQTIDLQAGDWVEFSWAFAPNGQASGSENLDSLFYTLHLVSATPSSVVVLTNNAASGSAIGYQVHNTGPVAQSGQYVLGFGVFNNASFGSNIDPIALIDAVIPEPSAVCAVALGAAVLLVCGVRRRGGP